jgi:hypothetical protein
MMNSVYRPPYTLTPAIVNLVAGISETIGRYTVLAEQNLTPRLRRENRIRTIQASLAIENNTLSVEQVTAVIEGKQVLGHPREIQEVRNAFAAYEAMEKWDARAEKDLLTAHELLMRGLMDETGRYRSGGSGGDRPSKRSSNRPSSGPDPCHRNRRAGQQRFDAGTGLVPPPHISEQLPQPVAGGRMDRTYAAGFPAKPDPALSVDRERPALVGPWKNCPKPVIMGSFQTHQHHGCRLNREDSGPNVTAFVIAVSQL